MFFRPAERGIKPGRGNKKGKIKLERELEKAKEGKKGNFNSYWQILHPSGFYSPEKTGIECLASVRATLAFHTDGERK